MRLDEPSKMVENGNQRCIRLARRVIPPGLGVNHLILKADQEARLALRLSVAILTFFSFIICAGKDSVLGLWSLPAPGQQQPDELDIPRSQPGLLRPDCGKSLSSGKYLEN